MEGPEQSGLPGFRFHPTEEELLDFYLRKAVYGKKLGVDIITTLNIYKHDPWELPGKARIGEREWYFFVPRDRRQSTGHRPNRTTDKGYWKATGTDRPVRSISDPKRVIGLKKTLVFYQGRAPKGCKTDWVMNEYRLPEELNSNQQGKDIVLCKIYRKATPLKELEQRAAKEEDSIRASRASTPVITHEAFSSSSMMILEGVNDPKEQVQLRPELQVDAEAEVSSSSSTMPRSLELPENMARNLPQLQLQVPNNTGMEWNQWWCDPLLSQLRSPWLVDTLSPYASLLNF